MPPPHAWPTLPSGTLQISVGWTIPATAPQTEIAPTSLFHFLARSPLPPGYVPSSAMNVACKFWVNQILDTMLPSSVTFVLGYYILADTPNPHVHPYLYAPFNHAGSDLVSRGLCSCFTRRCLPVGRHYVGRSSFVPVPAGYLTGSKYNPGGQFWLENTAAAMMNTITFDGITYDPALFSRALNVATPLYSVTPLEQPTVVRRRSNFRNILVQPWQYVFNP